MFNWFEFEFNLLSIDFNLISIWFQFDFNLLSVDFQTISIYLQLISIHFPFFSIDCNVLSFEIQE